MNREGPRFALKLALALLFALQSMLMGAVVPERWEKVEGLREGFPVVVQLKSGDLFVARFKALTPDTLIVDRTDQRKSFEVVRGEVCKIHSVEKVPDNPYDGLWKGALVGGIVSSPFVIWWLRNRDGDDVGSLTAGVVTFSLIIGTTVGGTVDALNTSSQEFYRAGSC